MSKDEFEKIRVRLEKQIRENDLNHPDWSDTFGQGIGSGLKIAIRILESEFLVSE